MNLRRDLEVEAVRMEIEKMVTEEIQIHTLKDGTQMVTALVAGRPIAMTSFEWRLLCRDIINALNKCLPKESDENASLPEAD